MKITQIPFRLFLIMFIAQNTFAQIDCATFGTPVTNRVLSVCYPGNSNFPIFTNINVTGNILDVFLTGNGLGNDLSCNAPTTFYGTLKLKNPNALFTNPTFDFSAPYFQIKISAAITHNLNFTKLQGFVGRDADGPKKVKTIYSLNNGSTWIDLGTEQTIGQRTGCNIGLTPIDLTFSEMAKVLSEQPILFRLYFYDAAATTGTCTLNNSAIFAEEFTPVPLELIDFQGFIKQENHHLTWVTLNENNVSHFEIEGSEDGKIFKNIGQVKAVGNSVEKQIYHFQNQTPQYFSTFYRLRMVDFDGKTDFSKIVNLRGVPKKIGLKIYPNPTSDNLTVEAIVSEQALLNVSDILGRIVFSKKLEADTEGLKPFNIATNGWAKGQYFLSVQTAKGVLIEKIAKL
jgi:hypothetical protein